MTPEMNAQNDLNRMIADINSIKDEQSRYSKLKEIIDKSSVTEQFEMVLSIVNNFKDSFWKTLALSHIAMGQYNNGFSDISIQTLEQALTTALSIPRECTRASLVASTAETCAEIGQKVMATRVFGQAIIIANSIAYIYEKDLALKDIAIHLSDAGFRDKGIEVAESISNVELRIIAFSRIAVSHFKSGNSEVAVQLLEQSLKLTTTIKDENSLAHSVSAIAESFSLIGQVDRAAVVMKMIRDKSQIRPHC